ncbi:hypothetical protein GGI42DRAFT_344632 [Trichoderma sp. SZMC 28013]
MPAVFMDKAGLFIIEEVSRFFARLVLIDLDQETLRDVTPSLFTAALLLQSAGMDELSVEIIRENPIGNGLDSICTLFASSCKSLGLSSLPTVLQQLDQLDLDTLRKITVDLFTALRSLKAVKLLPPAGRGQSLRFDISQFIPTIVQNDFDFDCVKPLLLEALDDDPNDIFIWCQVYNAVTEESPPPTLPIRWSSVTITRNTSSILNSSELPPEVDRVLKQDLDPRVDVREFRKSFFASVPRLEEAAEARLAIDFTPATVTQQRKLLAQPKTPLLGSTGRRSMDVGFVNDDVVYRPYAGKGRYRWSHVLVPGELKSNPMADAPQVAWIDLATYAREVLSAQYTRRFVLAFSLCGSLMRLWEYDRLGGIASEQFDINDSKGALEFVATMLGFLWMDEERLGFDPTMKTSDGKRFIEIKRDGQPERLIIDGVIARSRCIAGRATTCWKAHLEDDPQTAFVIKDSWQYPERDDEEREEEGEILREVTKQGVINVARYYHHETVRIRDIDDDIRNSVRAGLDITTAVPPTAAADAVTTPDSTATTVMANATTVRDAVATATVDSTTVTAVVEKASAASTSVTVAAVNATDAPDPLTADGTAAPRQRPSTAQQGKKETSRVQQVRQSESRSNKKNHGSGSIGSSSSSDNMDSTATTDSTGGAGTKRRFSQVNEAEERPAKRLRSELQATPPNRIHRRIIVQDYGRPIYKASSPAALVAAVEGCIQGHESLRKAGFLHRDISVNNVLIDEREGVQKGFLIDLDLAIRESRTKASGAKGKTGTRAFMAIGLLFDDPQCFMHDLESFFWVLFWVCVNHDGPNRSVKKNPFDHWNYANDYELAGSKLAVITDSFIFRKRAGECFTPFYEPLIPMMDRLREQVDEGLYSAMRDILRDGEKE